MALPIPKKPSDAKPGVYVHKTVQDFEAQILHTLSLTSGVDPHTLGPNIRGIIHLQAESMYAQQSAFEDLMVDIRSSVTEDQS